MFEVWMNALLGTLAFMTGVLAVLLASGGILVAGYAVREHVQTAAMAPEDFYALRPPPTRWRQAPSLAQPLRYWWLSKQRALPNDAYTQNKLPM